MSLEDAAQKLQPMLKRLVETVCNQTNTHHMNVLQLLLEGICDWCNQVCPIGTVQLLRATAQRLEDINHLGQETQASLDNRATALSTMTDEVEAIAKAHQRPQTLN